MMEIKKSIKYYKQAGSNKNKELRVWLTYNFTVPFNSKEVR